VIRAAWIVQRRAARIGDGRLVLKRPRRGRHAGMLRLRSRGRRSGLEREAIVDYVIDGDDLVTLAMNGWGATHPAWWLNLLAEPDAEVDTIDGTRLVRARSATPDETDRLQGELLAHPGWGDIIAFAATRPIATPIVVLSPRLP
jgi:deazaflavin-dependent oxidoreductase (nitroreductase family)